MAFNHHSSSLADNSCSPVRSFLLRKAPFFPSTGHATVVALYLAANLVITFTNMDHTLATFQTTLGSRCAWMAVGNIGVVVFLALKNTPLGYLTPWSYERLNVLHRVSGVVTVLYVILHGALYSAYFVMGGRAAFLLQNKEIYGMVAAFSFLLLGFSGAVLRKWWYEVFYYTHIIFWVVGIIMVGLHQPEFSKKIIYITCVAGAIWGADRVLRMSRLLLYSANNTAKLEALPNGATRVILKKGAYGAVSGQHCFLWIPRIRLTETHPFTIVSSTATEFVVASHNGFTRDLHKYAKNHPGCELKASLEGPYGKMPSGATCDKLVLVAGGGGASFTTGVALNALKQLKNNEKMKMVFIWVMKDLSELCTIIEHLHRFIKLIILGHYEWFSEHISTLRGDPRVSFHFHITGSTAPQAVTSSGQTTPRDDYTLEAEKNIMTKQIVPHLQTQESVMSIDSEKSITTRGAPVTVIANVNHQGAHFSYGRPDVSKMLCAEMDSMGANEHVLVMGCGPQGLMKEVRNTTASRIQPGTASVELHCEEFGW